MRTGERRASGSGRAAQSAQPGGTAAPTAENAMRALAARPHRNAPMTNPNAVRMMRVFSCVLLSNAKRGHLQMHKPAPVESICLGRPARTAMRAVIKTLPRTVSRAASPAPRGRKTRFGGRAAMCAMPESTPTRAARRAPVARRARQRYSRGPIRRRTASRRLALAGSTCRGSHALR